MLTGAKSPGIAEEARRALSSGPLRITSRVPVSSRVTTTSRGCAASSMRAPGGSVVRSRCTRPASAKRWWLRSSLGRARRGWLPRTRERLIPSPTAASLLPTSGPGWNAQNAALNAPTLVPTRRSGTSPARASTSMTPTWNAPRLAPPLKTTARRRGRARGSQDRCRILILLPRRRSRATPVPPAARSDGPAPPRGVGSRRASHPAGRGRDAESLEHRLQRRPLQSEAHSGAVGPAEGPVGLLEHPHDVCPLDAFERSGHVGLLGADASEGSSRREPGLVDREDVGLRDDHRALDDVLQLAHVPGPRIALDEVERPPADPAERLSQRVSIVQREVFD